jgi:nickel-type superoxide dismutase maturation protease
MTAPGYPRLLAGMAAATAAGAVVLAWRRVIRVEVQGASMAPTLQEGDRLVALGRLRGRPGDIVAVRDPRVPSRLLVKRVNGVEVDRSLRVSGDNPHASTDSRTFGPVPPALVVGRVVWRYWPPPRRGAAPRTDTLEGRPVGSDKLS